MIYSRTAMETQRYLLMKPAALLGILERAASGESPQDIMFEVLDVAANSDVKLKPEDE